MQFVLDCSVAMAWCFREERNEYVYGILESLSDWEALVPEIWSLELINARLVAERMKRLKEAETAHFMELIASLPIVKEGVVPLNVEKTLLSIGREHQLSSYDACYLELAIRRAIPLATQDTKLVNACKKSGVEIFKGKGL